MKRLCEGERERVGIEDVAILFPIASSSSSSAAVAIYLSVYWVVVVVVLVASFE